MECAVYVIRLVHGHWTDSETISGPRRAGRLATMWMDDAKK
jgi:hypothetical protein